MIPGSVPILSGEETRELETRLFAKDEACEWPAMQRAGAAVADAVLQDFCELGKFPKNSRVLVLAGKGHNGGDALIAAHHIAQRHPDACLEVCFAFGTRGLRPLAARAWRALFELGAPRVKSIAASALSGTYDLCLDGIFGFQFRPPAPEEVAALISQVNALPIRLRAAVDLPSAGLFNADFTYATGAVKRPVLEGPAAGRVRYLDLGFFSADAPGTERVLTTAVLDPLRTLRSPYSDKRTYGHVFIVAGSRNYPGAVMMAVRAALRSGVGLVTGFAPESMIPAFAASVPEAIWVGWPETTDGGLALEGLHLVREREDRATAFVIGPGIGREGETLALVAELVRSAKVPVLLDADALQVRVIEAATCPLVLTPHAGEFERIAGARRLPEYAAGSGATVILKGPRTTIASGGHLYHSFFGGPVLARGGSGDLLAGLTGGLLAQTPQEPSMAAVRGVVWHGLAADLLARAQGQVAVETTQVLEFLSPALRG